jgi:proteasome lid subunit RPN8/RPN11
MNTNNPDIADLLSLAVKEKSFPYYPNFRIIITKDAYETIIKHAKEDIQNEICGVLIGDYYKDADGPFLEISGVIRGEHAENEADHVMFTHATWSYINEIKDNQYAEEKIVGWYHSHPRFGVFLSDQDNFIHKNFFGQPWQVAFVVDPVSENEGFFVWQGGTTIRCEKYWVNGLQKSIYGEIKELDNKRASMLDLKASTLDTGNKKYDNNFMYLFALLILNLIIVAYMAFSFFENSRVEQAFFEDMAKKQYWMIMNEIKTIDTKKMVKVVTQNFGKSISLKQNGNRIWAFGNVYTKRQKDILLNILSSVNGIEAIDLQGVNITSQYTTIPGDDLYNIAWKIYADSTKSDQIYKLNKNKLRTFDDVPPETLLLLPE